MQWPRGSDPDPWPPLQREKRWSVSSGGATERTLSSVSPPGLGGGEWALSTALACANSASPAKGLPIP